MKYFISYMKDNRGPEMFWDGERFRDWSESARLYSTKEKAEKIRDTLPAEYSRDDLQIYGQVNDGE